MIDSIILWIVVLVRDCIGSSNRIGTSTAHRQIIAWHSHNHRLCSLVKRWRSIWEKKRSEVRSVSASIFHHVRTPQYVSASALSTNIDVDDVASMFTVGLAAGIIGTLLGFPLDLVKTRWAELLMQNTCMNQYRIFTMLFFYQQLVAECKLSYYQYLPRRSSSRQYPYYYTYSARKVYLVSTKELGHHWYLYQLSTPSPSLATHTFARISFMVRMVGTSITPLVEWWERLFSASLQPRRIS